MIRYRLTEMVLLTLLEVSGLGLMVLGYLQAESPGGLLGWMLLAALGVVLGAAGLWRLHRRQQYGSGLSLKLLGGGGTISLLSGAQLLMQPGYFPGAGPIVRQYHARGAGSAVWPGAGLCRTGPECLFPQQALGRNRITESRWSMARSIGFLYKENHSLGEWFKRSLMAIM